MKSSSCASDPASQSATTPWQQKSSLPVLSIFPRKKIRKLVGVDYIPIDDLTFSFTNDLFHETTHLLDRMSFRGSNRIPGRNGRFNSSKDLTGKIFCRLANFFPVKDVETTNGEPANSWEQVKSIASTVLGNEKFPIGPLHEAMWNAQSITFFAISKTPSKLLDIYKI